MYGKRRQYCDSIAGPCGEVGTWLGLGIAASIGHYRDSIAASIRAHGRGPGLGRRGSDPLPP